MIYFLYVPKQTEDAPFYCYKKEVVDVADINVKKITDIKVAFGDD